LAGKEADAETENRAGQDAPSRTDEERLTREIDGRQRKLKKPLPAGVAGEGDLTSDDSIAGTRTRL
jgi:hypothetical protein